MQRSQRKLKSACKNALVSLSHLSRVKVSILFHHILVFVNLTLIIGIASEKCQQEKRKTVNGEDILFAMTSLGFENYAEALKIYLSKYRETQSARGENQRPPSSGYGGPVPGAAGQGRPGFPDSAEGANSIMNPTLDPSQADASAYGYAPMVGEAHNGAGGDAY